MDLAQPILDFRFGTDDGLLSNRDPWAPKIRWSTESGPSKISDNLPSEEYQNNHRKPGGNRSESPLANILRSYSV
jgi:hypothetical protein